MLSQNVLISDTADTLPEEERKKRLPFNQSEWKHFLRFRHFIDSGSRPPSPESLSDVVFSPSKYLDSQVNPNIQKAVSKETRSPKYGVEVVALKKTKKQQTE